MTQKQARKLFLNEDGSASSLDRSGFIEDLKQSETYSALIAADVNTTGGGGANGSDGGKAPSYSGSTQDRLRARLKKHGL